jgi:hypothetical protein
VSYFEQSLISGAPSVQPREEENSFSTEVTDMKIPEWLKPGLYGATCGAIALAVVGFTWGGWVTGATARQMAAEQSKTDVVAALSLICVDQSKRDPQMTEKIAMLKAASSWSRGDLVLKNGWATMPGTAEGNRQVADACAIRVGT